MLVTLSPSPSNTATTTAPDGIPSSPIIPVTSAANIPSRSPISATCPAAPANAALIRVLASDGYNTTIATSQPFTVNNRKPTPYIVNPVADQSYPAGESITLRGGATDAEDGGLSGTSLVWQVDGNMAGNGTDVTVAGLATGPHTATLTATDSTANNALASVNFTVLPLSIPLGNAPVLDGVCTDSSYAGAAQLQLKPYNSGSQATVQLLRSDNDLWACFSGMNKGTLAPGAYAGLRLDVNNSRDAQAQPNDYGFFAGEDGSVFTTAGNGSGGFAAAGPGGLQAQVSAAATTWSAELRIDKTALGGWDHLVGLIAGHYSLTSQGDDYLWPYASTWNKPNTWATAALGIQPVITALDPLTATVNDPAFTLTIEGSGFISGTVALWGGNELPTTLVNSEHMTATVSSSHLQVAGAFNVGARSPAPGDFASNQLPFNVEALPPTIASLSPNSAPAGSPATTLTVNGANFAADSQVLWNESPLLTQFVSPTQVKAQLSPSLLAIGQTAGVTVRNQLPDERISDALPFTVQPLDKPVFLPMTRR